MATTEVPTMSDPTDCFELTVAYRRGHWRLEVAGSLDLATGEQLIEVSTLVVPGAQALVEIDMSGVDFIDTAGLHSVAKACRILRLAGATPAVVGASSPAVMRLLDALETCGLGVDLNAADSTSALARF